MNRYILEPYVPNLFHAGSKARQDVNSFLGDMGYRVITFKVNDSRKFALKVKNYLSCLLNLDNIMYDVEPGSIVLIQYPYPHRFIIFESIVRKLSKKGVTMVALVHDIDALRLEMSDKEIKREIGYLNSFDHVISHNTIMTRWLMDKGLSRNIVDLELFDYKMNPIQYDETGTIMYKNGCTVVFAGNLSAGKSRFLYNFTEDMLNGITVNLYGVEYDDKSLNCKNICYKGVFEPDELPHSMKGDYGLVWDGMETNTCSGHYGQYMRFNNPHKFSLYIAAGLPVITWRNAAISDMVSKNKIGLLVDSLSEISDAISEVDDSRYLQMKANVRSFQQKVTSGHYIQNAVKIIENTLGKEHIHEI